MDMAQFIFYAGWFFFGVWGIVLGTVTVIAFGPDILDSTGGARDKHQLPLR